MTRSKALIAIFLTGTMLVFKRHYRGRAAVAQPDLNHDDLSQRKTAAMITTSRHTLR